MWIPGDRPGLGPSWAGEDPRRTEERRLCLGMGKASEMKENQGRTSRGKSTGEVLETRMFGTCRN